MKKNFEFNIKHLLIFTKDLNNLIFNFDLNNNDNNNNKLNLLKSITKNLLNKNNKNNINNNNITITEIIISMEKIFILNIKNSNIIIIGIFSLLSKNSIINLFLNYIAVSFFNFIGEKSDYVSINTYFNTGNDKLKSKIYETFLYLPLLNHFTNIIHSLFKKKSLVIPNSKYENFLILDLNSKNIIFKFNSLLNKKKIFNISNFDSLLDELLFHSMNLKEMYSKKYQNRFDSIEYQDYYVKLEYTSTFPRLTFKIKFLPVLKGLALIHIYSTSKLSRPENDGNKIYKEFDVFYGVVDNYNNNGNNYNNSSIKESHLEYKFIEPKILKEIETFFIEFLISSHSAFGFFYFPKDEFKYFNKDILNIINDTIKENENCENNENVVISKLTKKLYDEYLIENRKENDNNNNVSFQDNINILNVNNNNNDFNNIELVSSYQWNFLNLKKEISNLFQISKKFSLEIIFKNVKINNDINPDDITINLTKIEDENSVYNKLDDLINNDQSYILRTNSFVINKNDVKMQRKLSSISYNDNISINSSTLKKDLNNNIIKKTVSNNKILIDEEQLFTFKNDKNDINNNNNNNNNNKDDNNKNDNNKNKNKNKNDNNNDDLNTKRQTSEGNENSKLIEDKFNYLQKKNLFNEDDIDDDNN